MSLLALREALTSAAHFVTAHYLLTRLAGAVYETFPTWNGLEVKLAADGATAIDPEQRFALSERWKQWHESRGDGPGLDK